MASSCSSPVELDLGRVLELLRTHITAALCQTVFAKMRITERQRRWTLQALVEFWLVVILRAPCALARLSTRRSKARSSSSPTCRPAPRLSSGAVRCSAQPSSPRSSPASPPASCRAPRPDTPRTLHRSRRASRPSAWSMGSAWRPSPTGGSSSGRTGRGAPGLPVRRLRSRPRAPSHPGLLRRCRRGVVDPRGAGGRDQAPARDCLQEDLPAFPPRQFSFLRRCCTAWYARNTRASKITPSSRTFSS